MANAPSAHQGKLEAASKAKVSNDEDKEIEAMLAQLKAWSGDDKICFLRGKHMIPNSIQYAQIFLTHDMKLDESDGAKIDAMRKIFVFSIVL